MKNSDKTKNMEKYYSYKLAFERIALAIENKFPLEAITIEESIINDRLRAYCEANTMGRMPKTFCELIDKTRKHAKTHHKELFDILKKQGNDGVIVNASESIDIWRTERNKLLHGMVKTDKAGEAPSIPASEFMDRALKIAEFGKQHARKVCDISNKLRRQKENLLKKYNDASDNEN